jgi:SAM-dependent methyltransferase
MSHHHDHDHDHDHGGGDDASLADLLDLEAEVLHAYWTNVLTWLRAAAAPGTRRILDLGAGTGTGSIALAQRFGDAEVIAVDASAEMLERIRVKALDLGLAPRVRTVRADFDDGWPEVGPLDLTWASMSLHHLAEPDRVLRDVRAGTRPGGLLAVAELAEPFRFLPDDLGLGRPGLETRCLDALDTELAHELPELGSQWAPRIEAAGFALLAERTVSVVLDPPHHPSAPRFARLWLQRVRTSVGHRLNADDRSVLDVLLDDDGPQSLLRRDDLQVRAARTISLAQA